MSKLFRENDSSDENKWTDMTLNRSISMTGVSSENSDTMDSFRCRHQQQLQEQHEMVGLPKTHAMEGAVTEDRCKCCTDSDQSESNIFHSSLKHENELLKNEVQVLQTELISYREVLKRLECQQLLHQLSFDDDEKQMKHNNHNDIHLKVKPLIQDEVNDNGTHQSTSHDISVNHPSPISGKGTTRTCHTSLVDGSIATTSVCGNEHDKIIAFENQEHHPSAIGLKYRTVTSASAFQSKILSRTSNASVRSIQKYGQNNNRNNFQSSSHRGTGIESFTIVNDIESVVGSLSSDSENSATGYVKRTNMHKAKQIHRVLSKSDHSFDRFQRHLKLKTSDLELRNHESNLIHSDIESRSSTFHGLVSSQKRPQQRRSRHQMTIAKDNDETDLPMMLNISSYSSLQFWKMAQDRGLWLIGLLILQSMSSFIISRNEALLQKHIVIVQFLTMLVGAGGNAGNQASVNVIRGLAVGTINKNNLQRCLQREICMAVVLSSAVAIAGWFRALLFQIPLRESIAITTSLYVIVFLSVVFGAALPMLMKFTLSIDPAHSSTSIQVIMDILGVMITVYVSSIVLNSTVLNSWIV